MKYRISAVVAMIVAMFTLASAQTFVPPANGEHYCVQASGYICVLASDLANLKSAGCSISSKPEIRTSLKTDADGNWIEGMTMQLIGNYYVWYCGQQLDVNSPVEFCVGVSGVGKKVFVPHLYMYGKYRSLATSFINWNQVISNGGGGYNYSVAVQQ
jgi:hypothetical protein